MDGLNFTTPVPYESRMLLRGFSSGEPSVDGWFVKHGADARRLGTAIVYLSYPTGADIENVPPAGFYTLSTDSVERAKISGGWLKRNSPSRVPVILLGQMGVDKRFQGIGLGTELVLHAIKTASFASKGVGAKALVVDPLDDALVGFYREIGFELIPGLEPRMYLPLR